MITNNDTIIKAVSVIATSSINAEILLADEDSYFLDVEYTGSGIAGSVKLQQSADGETFRDVPGSTEVISAAGDKQYNRINEKAAKHRVVCEATTGTITFTAVVCRKRIPA